MITDVDLLNLLKSKDIYYKYSKLVSEYVTKETEIVVADIDTWFNDDSTRTVVDWSAFATWFKTIKHPEYKKDKQDFYQEVFNRLQTQVFDPTLEKQIVTKIIDRGFASGIAEVANKVAQGDSTVSIEDIESLVKERDEEIGKVDKVDSYIVTQDIHELADHVVGGHGYTWRLDCLNKALGPLRKGDFIVFGARPDAGKTTMLASEATFIAPQMQPDEHVIWFNNEEEGKKVKWRVIQAALGWTSADMQTNLLNTKEEYERLLSRMDRVIIVDKKSPALHINDVRPILDKYKPGLIIFDQLRKVHGYDKETNEVMRLQHLFQFAREIAKEYAPVINVHQARGDAEGVRFIEMNQLHNSQTDIQGEADAIVTIGRSHEKGLEKSRFIYVPKNKLAGGPTSDESLRNGKFEIIIKPEIARFEMP